MCSSKCPLKLCALSAVKQKEMCDIITEREGFYGSSAVSAPFSSLTGHRPPGFTSHFHLDGTVSPFTRMEARQGAPHTGRADVKRPSVPPSARSSGRMLLQPVTPRSRWSRSGPLAPGSEEGDCRLRPRDAAAALTKASHLL